MRHLSILMVLLSILNTAEAYAHLLVNAHIQSIQYPSKISFASIHPHAPRGSLLRLYRLGHYDHTNPFLQQGILAEGSLLQYDSLLTQSPDHTDQYYGLLASAMTFSHDKKSITVKLVPATFYDGSDLMASDVASSLNYLIHNGPLHWQTLSHYQLSFQPINDQTLIIQAPKPIPFSVMVELGQMPIAKQCDLASIESPIGSGPYRLDRKNQSQVRWQRNSRYWAYNAPINQGRYNFDGILYQYYRNTYSAYVGFKIQEYDIRRELYHENWLQLQSFQQSHPNLSLITHSLQRPIAMQGFFFNQHRSVWNKHSMRKAMAILFPFDAINDSLFNRFYTRLESYYTNIYPSPKAPPYLKPLPKKVVHQLLEESGWVLDGEKRVHRITRELLHINLVVPNRELEKIANIYAKTCRDIGIGVTIRRLDPSYYYKTLQTGDFDMAYWNVSYPLNTKTRLENQFRLTSNANNLASVMGIHDAHITKSIQDLGNDPQDHARILTELDQYLMEKTYCIPFWYPKKERIAYWGDLCRPSTPTKLKTYYHWWPCSTA